MKKKGFYKIVATTSAVSSTDWVVDTINSIIKVCKLCDTSGSFVLYFIYDMVLASSTCEVL